MPAVRLYIAALSIAGLITLPSSIPAHAQSGPLSSSSQGSIAHFLARSEPLLSLGPFALAHPVAKQLRGEMLHVARLYKSRNDAQSRAGSPRKSCPPESGDLPPEIWIAHLRSYPAPMRSRITLSTAFEQLMEKHFPCPAR